uniref:ATP synthase complex subunit 8 n=1 Tax=Blattodea sp. MT-2014 TaxID=1560009 RepID=A0A0A0RZ28_9NEOP|nr:ATP synthase F0 subunit 8 [Blattodea sp. MT-2014]
MPQMMPMSWSILYIMFLLIFMMFNITNYYINVKYMKDNLMKHYIKSKPLTWKW